MPNANPILLLHGFSNTSACWQRLRGAGVEERCSVIAPDLRGHGTASEVRPVTLGGVLDDLDLLLPDAGAVVVGYSQGGRIALHAALDPVVAGRISRLVLVGASPGIADPAERFVRQAADESLASRLEAGTIEAFDTEWARTPVLAGLSPVLAEEASDDRRRNTVSGLAAALRGLGTGALPSLWERLGEIGVPVTLVAGSRDEKFTQLAFEMAALIPDARVEVVPKAGHQVHLQRPDALAAML